MFRARPPPRAGFEGDGHCTINCIDTQPRSEQVFAAKKTLADTVNQHLEKLPDAGDLRLIQVLGDHYGTTTGLSGLQIEYQRSLRSWYPL